QLQEGTPPVQPRIPAGRQDRQRESGDQQDEATHMSLRYVWLEVTYAPSWKTSPAGASRSTGLEAGPPTSNAGTGSWQRPFRNSTCGSWTRIPSSQENRVWSISWRWLRPDPASPAGPWAACCH